ncbi:uncharacterized protein LOC115442809 [Manduca sexta]|uniref:uncharacterized protein LOC115442809 n=1 Tax=Manduca sexta TaxID=7130 RepID=UPI0018903E67|nr:uncharacterized protein LOC115442809 [Manduca sexta]
MPAEDVSDLKDVVEAINRLCETMKASDYDDEDMYEDCGPADEPADEPVAAPAYVECSPELVSPEQVTVRSVETYRAERWSEDADHAAAVCEPPSEMYYTASSEVSLLSDLDLPERGHEEDEREEKKECVMAGHVAAMRERFESMTRTNTPCPDLMRSSSPSLDVFRNITPSPDRLG